MRANLNRRLRRVEQVLTPEDKEPFRVIITLPWKKLDLTRSTCTRYRCDDGTVTEVLHLDGDAEDISPEELEQFIQSFPIRD